VGAVGHRAATAIFTASRTTDARASAEYEIRQMLDSFATRHIGASSCDIALAAFVASTGGSELRDPWERPYAPACVMDGSQAVIVVASGGPDCRLGTPDDIIGTAVVR
jgi:hypothetical protein